MHVYVRVCVCVNVCVGLFFFFQDVIFGFALE